MKSLQTCATKASTPLKDPKQNISFSSLSNSNQRRKSLTVYSAVKNANNQIKESDIQKNQINKPKIHLKLMQSRKKQMDKVDSDTMSRKQETGGVIIKMNLCGPKGCDISIQNSYKFLDEPQIQKQSHQKKNRVLYQSRNKTLSVSESQTNNSIDFKLINLPGNQQNKDQFNQIDRPKKLNFQQQQSNPSTPFNKIKQSQQYNNNLQNKKFRFLEVQKLNNNSILHGQISNISYKNEKKPESRQQHTKNDSFSIRHYSSYVDPLQSSFLNNSQQRAQHNIQNFDKLKQIYRDSLKSELTSQLHFSNKFYFQSPLIQNSHKSSNQNLSINIKDINEKQTAQKTQNSHYFHQKNGYNQSPLDTSRTIIQILNDWDCKSDLYPHNQSLQQISRASENPQNLSKITMLKKHNQ